METKRLTYSESRTINIGDYESIKCSLSYSTTIESINEKEQVVTIDYSDTVNVDEDKNAFEDTIKKSISRVRKVLDVREADIRIRTQKFCEHDSGKKGLLLGLMKAAAWFKKQDKFKVEADLIEDIEDGVEYE